jgi:hypothetical protein
VHGITDGLDTIMYVVNDTCGADTAFFPIEIGACGLGVNAIGNLSTSSLNIYPNPSHSSFIVSLLSSTAQTAQIVIFNMLGEKVKEYSISANKETELHIDVPGVYFISVFAGSENINKKIIVE